jgi:hypothetical protein
MTSFEPPNAAQLLTGTRTSPGVLILMARSTASASSPPPAEKPLASSDPQGVNTPRQVDFV